ncbi:hypothetical protein CEP51_014102 [Fusarium floridanum]|uniref:Uncharacterized protein n=1 Tax=Fusarium floridanum TaxID=1325733 RepID=A0A428PZ18_9HYPO|nr:hypothetical protein CEP51_014102 [Fusarium floridanum]
MSTSANLRDLDPLDHPILFTLHQAFNDEDEYALLRLFVRGRVPGHEKDIAKVDPEALSYDQDGPYCDLYQAKTRIGDQLKQFYVCVLQHANVICTTPYASSSKPWKRFKAGDTLRPTAMARDENQLQPTVMTLMDKQDGNMLNQFAPDAQTSVLEHFKRTGQACFVLNEG